MSDQQNSKLSELEQKVLNADKQGITMHALAKQIFYNKDYLYKVLERAKKKAASTNK
ncbi:MAG: hypothetical protein FWD76_04305 [Firmicutes bacterium]|nr:hypothetical protein [Bacillota bacterium]